MAISWWICHALILAMFLLAAQQLNAYTFNCLDNCNCNTEDSVIYCPSGKRERLELPKCKLRGFDVILLARNQIRLLPSEDVLLEKFPDLKAVDLEGNPQFHCSTLDQYSKITVLSDCGKTVEELEKQSYKLIPPRKSEHCRQSDYGLHLWKVINETERIRQIHLQQQLEQQNSSSWLFPLLAILAGLLFLLIFICVRAKLQQYKYDQRVAQEKLEEIGGKMAAKQMQKELSEIDTMGMSELPPSPGNASGAVGEAE